MADKGLDSFLKQIRRTSTFLPKDYLENENNNVDTVDLVDVDGIDENKAPPVRGRQQQSRKRTERERDYDDVLDLDKDDDIQFVAEFLDDEVVPDLGLSPIKEKHGPKVKRPKRALDFDFDVDLEADLLLDLENIDRNQRKAASGPSTSTNSNPRPSTSAAAGLDDEEIVVRHRKVLRVIPSVPHVRLACPDGSRVYLRLFPDPDKIVVNTNPSVLEQINMLNESQQAAPRVRRNLLGVSLDELRRRHEEEQKKVDAIMREQIHESRRESKEAQFALLLGTRKKTDETLWVEKYKPRSYLDLLSEETINHSLLHWLKLWDNTVFGVDYLAKVKKTKEKYAALEAKEADRWKRVIVDDSAYDELGRPKQKVVLLHGPPGLGKTTAAHVICKHAGYQVMELNASDDRSVDVFKKALDSATQSRSEVFQDGKPTCLIIDEIDGAPLPSVQVLVDLVVGKSTEAGKNKTRKVLRRPIICICNELYTPSLKTLRKIALLLPFQPISVTSLVERLGEISLKEKLPVDQTLMYALAEKTDCDVRSCLSCIQFIKGKKCDGKEREKILDQLGIQDKTKGIFDIWKEIFEMPERKSRASYYAKGQHLDPTRVDARFDHILRITHNYGEYERLLDGVFTNCLKTNFRDSYFDKILRGLEWIDWFDQIQQFIKHQQNYSLMGLLPYYFVTAHFLYAGKGFKLDYPSHDTAIANRQINNMKSQIGDMEPCVARYVDVSALTLDIFPALVSIIQPSTIRPVPTQLWSVKERETIKMIVDTMLAYNLTYTQERSPEGNYVFVMDPDIESLVTFKTDEQNLNKKQFAYAVKQLIAREIETEKLRRGDGDFNGGVAGVGRMEVDEPMEREKKNIATKSQHQPFQSQGSQSQPMHIESQELTVTTKQDRKPKPFNLSDYFNVKVIKKKAAPGNDDQGKDSSAGGSKSKTDSRGNLSDIYYRYKSGYTNAVRRYVRMKDLL